MGHLCGKSSDPLPPLFPPGRTVFLFLFFGRAFIVVIVSSLSDELLVEILEGAVSAESETQGLLQSCDSSSPHSPKSGKLAKGHSDELGESSLHRSPACWLQLPSVSPPPSSNDFSVVMSSISPKLRLSDSDKSMSDSGNSIVALLWIFTRVADLCDEGV